MHVGLVAHGLPHPSSNGGPMQCFGLLAELIAEGHDVTVIALGYHGDPYTYEPESRERVRATGAGLVVVDVPDAPPRGRAHRHLPVVERVFPSTAARPELAQVLETVAPDVLFVYHWDTLAALHGLDLPPRLAGVDDPWHLPNLRRWQHSPARPTLSWLRWTWGTLRGVGPVTEAMVELLNACAGAVAFQSQTAAWLVGKGARHCDYAAAPLVDPGHIKPSPHVGPGRILLGPSQLRATSTRAGIDLFAREILPVLERELGADGFQVRIVGEGEPPPSLERLLPHPSVLVLGRIEPPFPEYAVADAQLVPTPFVLGKRVRILEGFARGACIVAHAAEAANLPELVDGENCLLGRTGTEIGRQLARALREPELNERLRSAARATYEAHFTPATAGRALVERLERIRSAGGS